MTTLSFARSLGTLFCGVGRWGGMGIEPDFWEREGEGSCWSELRGSCTFSIEILRRR